MPELPEVQTIVNDLNKKIVGVGIKKIEIRFAKIIKNDLKFFRDSLIGNSFQKVDRRGKLIIFKLQKNGLFLLVHLRMTGQIILQQCDGRVVAGGHSGAPKEFALPNKHTHIIFYFQNSDRMFFNDQRRFGVLKIVDDTGLALENEKFGWEPLDKKFNFKAWEKLLENKKTLVKAFLLNQKNIAGIGNIYADEILFDACVRPDRRIDFLNIVEKKKIFQAIKKILPLAVKSRGTTFNNYVDADGRAGSFVKKLKVYGRAGKKCLSCNEIIKKSKIVGRGTSYCHRCQR